MVLPVGLQLQTKPGQGAEVRPGPTADHPLIKLVRDTDMQERLQNIKDALGRFKLREMSDTW